MRKIIQMVDHGAYGVDPERCPLCPECDMPIVVGEGITLQTCDAGPGQRDLVRLVHTQCVDGDDDE